MSIFPSSVHQVYSPSCSPLKISEICINPSVIEVFIYIIYISTIKLSWVIKMDTWISFWSGLSSIRVNNVHSNPFAISCLICREREREGGDRRKRGDWLTIHMILIDWFWGSSWLLSMDSTNNAPYKPYMLIHTLLSFYHLSFVVGGGGYDMILQDIEIHI